MGTTSFTKLRGASHPTQPTLSFNSHTMQGSMSVESVHPRHLASS